MGNKQSTSKEPKKIIEKSYKIFKKKAFKFGFSVGANQAYDLEGNIRFGTFSAEQYIFDNMDENLRKVGINVVKSIQQKTKEEESNLVKKVPEILNKSSRTNLDKVGKEMTDEIKDDKETTDEIKDDKEMVDKIKDHEEIKEEVNDFVKSIV